MITIIATKIKITKAIGKKADIRISANMFNRSNRG
jgi:hypothetical protein